MEELERQEAIERGEDPDAVKDPIEGTDMREKQSEHIAKLEGYLDGELEDLFDSGHMQG